MLAERSQVASEGFVIIISVEPPCVLFRVGTQTPQVTSGLKSGQIMLGNSVGSGRRVKNEIVQYRLVPLDRAGFVDGKHDTKMHTHMPCDETNGTSSRTDRSYRYTRTRVAYSLTQTPAPSAWPKPARTQRLFSKPCRARASAFPSPESFWVRQRPSAVVVP
jgi:hypothetical protein